MQRLIINDGVTNDHIKILLFAEIRMITQSFLAISYIRITSFLFADVVLV